MMSKRVALVATGLGIVGWRLARRARTLDLTGRVVLITGGSRGLGLVMAREFASHGARLSICARDERELDSARRDLEARGAEVLTTRCDVAEREEVDEWVRRTDDRFGRIDVLVNNASIIQMAPLASLAVEDFEEAVRINYLGTVYATLAVLPHMRARGAGRIVNITSIGGKLAVPHLLPYSAAKFAALGFSEGLRTELARDGIAVTTIVPGLMRTGSPPNASFKGRHALEYTLFSLLDATPLTATSAGRAARRIVRAARLGEAEVTLTWQAKLARLAHGIAPGTFTNFLALVGRILPRAPAHPTSGDDQVRGMELATTASPSPATVLMNRAARQNNEYGGEPRPSPDHARQVGLREK